MVGGWVGGRLIPSGNITTSWLHLASWKLPDFQLSGKSKMEPSVTIKKGLSAKKIMVGGHTNTK